VRQAVHELGLKQARFPHAPPPLVSSRVRFLTLRTADARASPPTQNVCVLGVHHDVPDARTRVVLTPVLGA
jgi:hypothetical protein